MQYDNLSDKVLLTMSKSGDRAAEDALAARYARLVKICARPFFLIGGDSEDLTQEGMLGLISAIREYNPLENASFKTFAEQCVKNRIISAVRAAARHKHTPLNDGISLDEFFSSEIHTGLSGAPEALRRTPEERLLDSESALDFFTNFPKYLSRLEGDVLTLYLDGQSYREMAEHLCKSSKSVDNAVQRIRQKLTSYLTDREYGK